jgi:hypothetical protein
LLSPMRGSILPDGVAFTGRVNWLARQKSRSLTIRHRVRRLREPSLQAPCDRISDPQIPQKRHYHRFFLIRPVLVPETLIGNNAVPAARPMGLGRNRWPSVRCDENLARTCERHRHRTGSRSFPPEEVPDETLSALRSFLKE